MSTRVKYRDKPVMTSVKRRLWTGDRSGKMQTECKMKTADYRLSNSDDGLSRPLIAVNYVSNAPVSLTITQVSGTRELTLKCKNIHI